MLNCTNEEAREMRQTVDALLYTSFLRSELSCIFCEWLTNQCYNLEKTVVSDDVIMM